jgi:hypothetical protein
LYTSVLKQKFDSKYKNKASVQHHRHTL